MTIDLAGTEHLSAGEFLKRLAKGIIYGVTHGFARMTEWARLCRGCGGGLESRFLLLGLAVSQTQFEAGWDGSPW